MSADTIVGKALDNVPKAVASGVVDMGTGMLLAIKTTESHPQAVVDMVSAATKELFEGDMVVAIEDAFKKARGEDSNEHYFREILVSSKNLIHYFGRLSSSENCVVAVVTRVDANLGMVVAKAREITTSEAI
ncbi:MAG: hypothetical protein GWN84_07720 [Gammaproteobacteria bacterium]|nr:hypothetical protein [Gammaproteobacteria bacterium]NIR82770.1 hypothetical protein [Gammaproteobacteria bacterium]NIR89634.1 hypothetical protein [Gammaproteobacteria bacterium]NIU03930.1 hypothetical protein [Gammaproteobacteria bacterium]NIV51246.1 hypothetical protein [Gammaproteobacteria bacterium]